MKKLLIAMLALGALLAPIALASPANAVTPRVRLSSSVGKVVVGESFKITAAAKYAAPRQKAVLERKKSGSTWVRAGVKYLPRKGRIKHVTFSQTLNEKGLYTYRLRLLAKGKYSAAMSAGKGIMVTRPTPLRFNFSGARALALRQSATSSARVSNERVAELAPVPTSNLSVVTSAGLTANAVVSGNVTVQHFLIAADGSVFVAFSMPVNLSDTSDNFAPTGRCVLARVDAATGVPTCVDSSLMSLNWNKDSNPPVQFDQYGAVYYSGYSGINAVLRRQGNGVTTDLINENIHLSDFLVTMDGTVLVSGTTYSTGATWTRRIAPSGGLQTLLQGGSTLVRMPDAVNYALSGSTTYHFTPPSALDPGGWSGEPTGCSVCGSSSIHRRATTSEGKVFLPASTPSQIAQIYPVDAAIPLTTMQYVTQIAAVGSKVLIAGRTSGGVNALSSFDPAAGTDTALTDAAHELEVYHLEAIDGTTAMFDGLRFSDNTLVVGQVNVITGQVTILNTVSSKWEDFQTF